MPLANIYLESSIKRLKYYKDLADKTFQQLSDPDFIYEPDVHSNCIAVIIQHMAGNMISRWTDFLDSDGEKDWRNRDLEFQQQHLSRAQLMELWEKGWHRLLNTLNNLSADDLIKKIKIRGEEHFVVDAINRQLAHYPYHVGQIIYLGKMIRQESWKCLSIEKGKSDSFNQSMRPAQ